MEDILVMYRVDERDNPLMNHMHRMKNETSITNELRKLFKEKTGVWPGPTHYLYLESSEEDDLGWTYGHNDREHYLLSAYALNLNEDSDKHVKSVMLDCLSTMYTGLCRYPDMRLRETDYVIKNCHRTHPQHVGALSEDCGGHAVLHFKDIDDMRGFADHINRYFLSIELSKM